MIMMVKTLESSSMTPEALPNVCLFPSLNKDFIGQIWVFFRQTNLIPIGKLFNFSNHSGWGEFWFQGVKNYKQEMAFYDLLAQGDCNVTGSGGPGIQSR
jgi:hypothetical protein